MHPSKFLSASGVRRTISWLHVWGSYMKTIILFLPNSQVLLLKFRPFLHKYAEFMLKFFIQDLYLLEISSFVTASPILHNRKFQNFRKNLKISWLENKRFRRVIFYMFVYFDFTFYAKLLVYLEESTKSISNISCNCFVVFCEMTNQT